MLGGKDGGGDGDDDADGGSVSATSGVAQLLLASESLLGLLLLQEILDGIARRTRLLEHFERVLEFRLDSVRDVVAGEVVFRLLAAEMERGRDDWHKSGIPMTLFSW